VTAVLFLPLHTVASSVTHIFCGCNLKKKKKSILRSSYAEASVTFFVVQVRGTEEMTIFVTPLRRKELAGDSIKLADHWPAGWLAALQQIKDLTS